MGVFAELTQHDYGSLHLKRDAETGLQAIVAIHDSTLGPALGGCRFIHYANEELALVDALRLARGMTYKAAITGLPHGGGKSVIMRPERTFDRGALFRAFGRFMEELGGRYITAEDSGTSTEDMDVIRRETKHVTGVRRENGGSGDPSPFTALGVRRGIEASVKFALGRNSLEGVRVAVQGVGHVGYHLCKELHALGATLVVADVELTRAERAQKEFGATLASLNQIFGVECDVFAPCALGGVINDDTLPRLKCKIVAGAANNQLAENRHGDALFAKGILYAPDYAINAGGLVNVAEEYAGYNEPRARERVLRIYDTMAEIFDRAQSMKEPTYKLADAMARERLKQAKK